MGHISDIERFFNLKEAVTEDRKSIAEKLTALSGAMHELYVLGFDINCSVRIDNGVHYVALERGFNIESDLRDQVVRINSNKRN